MASNAVELKLFIDPTGALKAISDVGTAGVDAQQKMAKATSNLTNFIREQRAENRQQNFLLNEGRQTIGALSLAITSFGAAGTDSMKKITDSVGQGVLAFQGFEFALSALGVGGPMGIAIAGVAALTTVLVPLIMKSDEAKASAEALRIELEKQFDLRVKLGEIPEPKHINQLKEELALTENSIAVAKRSGAQWDALETRRLELLSQIKSAEKSVNDIILSTLRTLHPEAMKKYDEESSKANALANLQKARFELIKQGRGEELKQWDALIAKVQSYNVEQQKSPRQTVMLTATQKLLAQETELKKELEEINEVLKATNLTEFQRNRLLERRTEIIKELNKDKFLKPVKVIDFDPTQEMIEKATKDLQEQAMITEQIFAGVGQSIQTTFQNIFTNGGNLGKDFLKGILNTFITAAEGILLTASAAAAGKSIFNFGSTLLADIAEIAVGFATLETVRGIVNSMAHGALAFGPTLALVGDNPGASRDPEVIAPLSKLSTIMRESVTLVPQALSGNYDFRRLEGKLDRLAKIMGKKNFEIAVEQKFEGQDFIARNLTRAQRSIERRKIQ